MADALLAGDDPRLAPSRDLTMARALIAGSQDDPALAATAAAMLAFVDAHPDALVRSCLEGHLTGSAIVIEPRIDRTLVIFHAKLRKWLQPGGHADGDANLAAVARREAEEETGIRGLRVLPMPIDLDIHRVEPPWEEPHYHYDVRFLVVAPDGARAAGNHESIELRWSREYELLELGTDPSLQRLARRGFEAAARIMALEDAARPRDTVVRARETAKAIVAGRTHPFSGAMAIWADVRDAGGDGYPELRAFIGLASEWQVNEGLRDVIEEGIRQAAVQLLEESA
jgi:8-oxo-dGTP pyrophosphatase MutT (NUDIX family)